LIVHAVKIVNIKMFINSIFQTFVFGGLSKRPPKKNDTMKAHLSDMFQFLVPQTSDTGVECAGT